MNPPKSARHSAVVKMELHIAGQIVRIAQAGRGMVMAWEGIDCPPSQGEFHTWIDGQHKSKRVYLPNGMTKGYVETKVELDKDYIALPDNKAA